MKLLLNLALCVYILAAFCPVSPAAELQLKPAAYVGMAYRQLQEADRQALKSEARQGLVVTKVLAGSPAEKAGLKPDDLIVKFDGNEIKDQPGFVTLLRSYHGGDRITVSLKRNGKDLQLTLNTVPFPRETAGDLDVEYTAFSSGGSALRAVVVSPLNSAQQRLPALFMVSALGSPRLAALPFYDMWRQLAYAAARRGFRVLRFELRGSGDSQGEDYRDGDFSQEISDNRAALAYLRQRSDVDPERVFIMGHSTGGQIAAILAGEKGAAGLITSCTIGRTHFERSLETLRIQKSLAGKTPAAIDTELKSFVDLLVSVSNGEPVEAILKRNPDLGEIINKDTKRMMDDRTAAYWKQQLALNLADIYGKVKVPVLIIHGTSDFLTFSACHEHIRDLLKSSGNSEVTLAEIANMDHKYALAADMKESWQNYKTQNFKPNNAGTAAVCDWLARRTSTR
jgi:alpha-beta hydrolase superfamily lysophospholipase